MFGKLSWDLIPTDPIVLGAGYLMAIGIVLIVILLTVFKKWGWLYRSWLTTTDHKKIGVMYIILAIIMLLRGFADAIMMRLQQMLAASSPGYLPPEHFDQVFTAHGVIMIFFMAMPFMFGLMNIVTPLQIGARDVAFPFMNALSFWLTAVSAALVNLSLVLGNFARTGWVAYPPLSNYFFSPDVGMDYYIWSLQISGIGSLLGGVNFITTILKMRAPGMTLMKMPVFVWSVLCSNILIALTFPILTVALTLLFLDRYIGTHFFTNSGGGNPMLYVNMIWAWGHPEVYVLVLPAFGIYSEIVAVFARKKLFGYTTMVYAIAAITILSYLVWAHHFFTMGAGSGVNTFFGITTMIISIPTGVKIFNWLFTMYRGRITLTVPMLWTIAFLITFAWGGMTGVLMSIPAADFQLHNSVFLVAHFHNTIIGGVVFGYLGGFVYWFPKAMGFNLNKKLGAASVFCWVVGFFVAFVPLYIVGAKGMSRRLQTYDAATGWQPYLIVAAIGAVIIALGIAFFVLALVLSVIKHKKYKDTTGDPWDGRTLEWSIPSPAPSYNFAVIPTVDSLDQFWYDKQNKKKKSTHYEDIHMPKNTPIPLAMAIFAFLMGFGFIFDITWLVILAFILFVVAYLFRVFDYNREIVIPADEVRKIEENFYKGVK